MSLLDEVMNGDPHCLTTDAASVKRGGHEDVECDVPVIGVGFLRVLEPAGHGMVYDDHPAWLAFDEIATDPRGVALSPPAGHSRLGKDRGEWFDVAGRRRAEQDAVAAQGRRTFRVRVGFRWGQSA